MITLNDKFKVVNSFEELSQETSYNVLYITNDPDKVLIFYLMTMQYRALGGSYASYNHCSYLGGNVIAWIYKDNLPEGFADGLHYKGFDRYEKYRTSFPFPFTPAKYSDSEVVFKIEEVKALMKGYTVTITDRKSLKAKWNDVVFNMTWMKGWIQQLADIEKKKIEEQKMEANDHFQNFLTEVFSGIEGLERQHDYWDHSQLKNEWRAKFQYGEVRFTPYKRKQDDGTYVIEAASALFGDRQITKNHRKVIIKLLQMTKKYHEDLFNLLVN